MFYKISLNEDIEKVAGVFAKNGYTVCKAKRKRAKGTGYDYGIDISGNGEAAETEEDDE